ncbi:MAG: hypothetical protein ACR2IJ_07975 [Fluviibacter sp.]
MSSFRNQFAQQKQEEQDDRQTMCRAHECPNRWSVSEGYLCGAHAWEPMDKWHGITDEQHRILAAKQGADRQTRFRPVSLMTVSQKKAAIAKLTELAKGGSRDPKRWAYTLRDRERNGEHLTSVQRQMWRDVISEHN